MIQDIFKRYVEPAALAFCIFFAGCGEMRSDAGLPTLTSTNTALTFDGETTLEAYVFTPNQRHCDKLMRAPYDLPSKIAPKARWKADITNERGTAIVELPQIPAGVPHIFFIRAINLQDEKIYACACKEFEVAGGETLETNIDLLPYGD